MISNQERLLWLLLVIFLLAALFWTDIQKAPILEPQIKPETSGPLYLNFTCEENC